MHSSADSSVGLAAGVGAPPASTTGVLTTSLVGCSVDWVAFTAPDGTALGDVLPGVVPDWVECERGGLGYSRSWTFGKVRAFSEGRPGMGVHVSLGSQALAEVAGLPAGPSPVQLLTAVVARGWAPSRVDLAVDDRSGRVTMDDVAGQFAAGAYTSRMRSVPERAASLGPVRTKDLITVGSRASDAYLRIYDKRLERLARGVAGDLPASWLRFEWEFKGAAAGAISGLLAAGDMGPVHEVLMGYLAFRDVGADSVKSRWAVSAWWRDLLGTALRRPLGVVKKVPTLEDVRTWLHRQVAPALACVVEAGGGSVDVVYELLGSGVERLRSRHRVLIAEGLAGLAVAS
jgi:hypothetical protein